MRREKFACRSNPDDALKARSQLESVKVEAQRLREMSVSLARPDRIDREPVIDSRSECLAPLAPFGERGERSRLRRVRGRESRKLELRGFCALPTVPPPRSL